MKRYLCLFLAFFLLLGCSQAIIRPQGQGSASEQPAQTPVPTGAPLTAAPTEAPTPAPAPVSALPTFPPFSREVRFAEQALSFDAEPFASQLFGLLQAPGDGKEAFYARFQALIEGLGEAERELDRLSASGRTMSQDRAAQTIESLRALSSAENLDALADVYAALPGDGEPLPAAAFSAAVDALCRKLESLPPREETFYVLGAAADYRKALCGYLGEDVLPKDLLLGMETLAQTAAYALQDALNADPEAARKKEPLTFGSLDMDLAFLRRVTETDLPLPSTEELPPLALRPGYEKMELPKLAFYTYPGMGYLKVFASLCPEAQQARWADAPAGYLAGLSLHGSYSILAYLGDFGADYVLYRWYEELLYATLTGISALLIHYYGYSRSDLADYLSAWGAASFADYLFDQAMFDPFDSLVAVYGYYAYLDICQAALDAGCESEARFLADYLAAGPAPCGPLKEYMVGLYENAG